MKPEVSLIPDKEIPTNDPRRLFTRAQRRKIFERANGCCELCGAKITRPGAWVAGHIIAHWAGGETAVWNGRVEGIDCGCAAKTAEMDKKAAAKNKRIRGITGRRKPGAKVAKIRSRGFDKRFKRKLNGKVVPNERKQGDDGDSEGVCDPKGMDKA